MAANSTRTPIVLGTVFFILSNGAFMVLRNKIETLHMDYSLLLFGNVLLFLLFVVAMLLHTKAARNSNPNVLVRSIMASMLIKMLAIGTGIVVYAMNAKQNKSIPSVAIIMALYLIYLLIEVKSSYKLNKKKPADAGN